jgi:hypothetical protein
MSASSISKHASCEVLGERRGFLGGFESGTHHDAAGDVPPCRQAIAALCCIGLLTSSGSTAGTPASVGWFSSK